MLSGTEYSSGKLSVGESSSGSTRPLESCLVESFGNYPFSKKLSCGEMSSSMSSLGNSFMGELSGGGGLKV